MTKLLWNPRKLFLKFQKIKIIVWWRTWNLVSVENPVAVDINSDFINSVTGMDPYPITLLSRNIFGKGVFRKLGWDEGHRIKGKDISFHFDDYPNVMGEVNNELVNNHVLLTLLKDVFN